MSDNMSTVSASTAVEQPSSQDFTLKKRPWRRYTTPWSNIQNNQYAGKGTEEEPFVVDWLPNSKSGEIMDFENPMTWNDKYKWSIVLCVSVATLAVAMASSTLSGATISIMETFPNYATQVYVMVTSGFVLGFVVGPLLWAPMSEIYGRRSLFIFTYILFTIFNGGVIASQNVWTLIILRFLAGTAGSSPLVNSGGVIADLFQAHERGLGMAMFAAAPFLGPAIGPICGGFLGTAGGWRWVAALLAIFTALLTVLGFVAVPESYAPVLLRKRAVALEKANPGKVYRSKFEKDKKVQVKQLFKTALGRPWVLLFREPIVFLLSLYLAIVYGTLYMLFGAFPIVFEQLRGWSPGLSGTAFIGPLIGFMSAILWTIIVENPRYSHKLDREGGWLAPEQRLYPAMIGGCLMPIGLIIFAWTAYPISIHWIVCEIFSTFIGFGMVAVFLSVFNYLVDSYLLHAASVLAANSVLRSLFGVGFPLFVSPMFANLGVNKALTIVAALSFACAPMPFIFFKYGKQVRLASKFAREADELAARMRGAPAKPVEEKKGEQAA